MKALGRKWECTHVPKFVDPQPERAESHGNNSLANLFELFTFGTTHTLQLQQLSISHVVL